MNESNPPKWVCKVFPRLRRRRRRRSQSSVCLFCVVFFLFRLCFCVVCVFSLHVKKREFFFFFSHTRKTHTEMTQVTSPPLVLFLSLSLFFCRYNQPPPLAKKNSRVCVLDIVCFWIILSLSIFKQSNRRATKNDVFFFFFIRFDVIAPKY